MAASSAVQTLEPTQPFYATGKRSRDLAREQGMSEAALLAAHDGPEVVRLGGEIPDLIRALPDLGEVMSLTRNEAAVHEKTGTFGNISVSGRIGLVLNDAIDLRLFLQHWCTVFAVEIPDETGPRRSLQVFDRSGDAVIKVHLKPASDVPAFERLRARFADPEPAPLRDAPAEPPRRRAVRADRRRGLPAGLRGDGRRARVLPAPRPVRAEPAAGPRPR
jgi:putative hemin transport protein